MLNCRQATRLVSEAHDRPLHLGERLSLHLHMVICSSCANFRKQMAFLAQVSHHFREGRRPDGDGDS